MRQHIVARPRGRISPDFLISSDKWISLDCQQLSCWLCKMGVYLNLHIVVLLLCPLYWPKKLLLIHGGKCKL